MDRPSVHHSQNLLKYWHKIEHFNPAPVEYGAKLVQPGALPWQGAVKGDTFKVSLGVFPIGEAVKAINAHFGTEDKNPNHNPTQKTCFATLTLDRYGRPVEDTFGISTLPWAVSKLLKGEVSDDWSDPFALFCRELVELMESLFEPGDTLSGLMALNDALFDEIAWHPTLLGSGIYCQKAEKPYVARKDRKEDMPEQESGGDGAKDGVTEKEKPEEEEEEKPDLLNSFFIHDLEMVLGEGRFGKALSDYLNAEVERAGRQDLIKDISPLKSILSPVHLTASSWPSEYPLSLMQQAAVNYTKKVLGESRGLFSVNGPPGTGKTTLLRDIIAEVLTERALKLLRFDTPEDAFEEYKTIDIEDSPYTYRVFEPDSSLCSSGMVIASSNNGAVENISKELPMLQALYEGYHDLPEADYFRTVASSMLDMEAWGLISAPLGNRKNCADFANRFWIYSKLKDRKGDFRPHLNFRAYLDGEDWGTGDWKEAQKGFREAFQAYGQLRDARMDMERNIGKASKAKGSITALEDKIAALKEKVAKAQQVITALKQEVDAAEEEKNRIHEHLELLEKTKPSSLRSITDRQASQNYRDKKNRIGTALQDVLGLLEEKYGQLCSKGRQLQELEKETKVQEGKKEEREKELSKAGALTGGMDALPVGTYWEQDPDILQKSSPWMDAAMKEARDRVFLASLHLHKAFILCAKDKIRGNLSMFSNILLGNVSKRDQKEVLQKLWDTFFLVVPVVSTTFASFSRLFEGMGQESLGWLIVDEAGQATPQSCAGALYRSQRAVVVGDPLQIEPVVTLPGAIHRHFAGQYGIEPLYASPVTSVQSIADQLNPYGTYIKHIYGKTWIGCPLRVHRRCHEPMFRISNTIAYNGMMVYGTLSRPKPLPDILRTRFIDVKEACSTRHFVQKQGDVAARLVYEAIQYYRDMPSLYIISPFSKVASEMKQLMRNYARHFLSLGIDPQDYQQWVKKSIGTVHTFQGKQADIVVLCLGVDQDSIGAARWAASKPNLLNVALTRAKQRFIAIGDQDIWLSQNHFNELEALEKEIVTS